MHRLRPIRSIRERVLTGIAQNHCSNTAQSTALEADDLAEAQEQANKINTIPIDIGSSNGENDVKQRNDRSRRTSKNQIYFS